MMYGGLAPAWPPPALRRAAPAPASPVLARAAALSAPPAAPRARQRRPLTVSLDGVTVTYKDQMVLEGATWQFTRPERVGLVGVNGCGKTTQLRVICGTQRIDGGSVHVSDPGARIGWLTQEPDLGGDPERSLREVLLGAFERPGSAPWREEARREGAQRRDGGGRRGDAGGEGGDTPPDRAGAARDPSPSTSAGVEPARWRMERIQDELEALAARAEGEGAGSDEEAEAVSTRISELLDQLSELSEWAAAEGLEVGPGEEAGGAAALAGGGGETTPPARDGSGAEGAAADRMLAALGFSPSDASRPIGSFSGGWQMRAGLGRVLLRDPDLLLLDEPTNHLDLEATAWLENHLRGLDLSVVVVSHDRAFLDAVCTRIVETERGRTASFDGNYTAFVAAKRGRLAKAWAAWEKRQKEEARLRDLVQRLRGGANSGRATAAAKELERLQSPAHRVERPWVSKGRKFAFPSAEGAGALTVEAVDVRHGYRERASAGTGAGGSAASSGSGGILAAKVAGPGEDGEDGEGESGDEGGGPFAPLFHVPRLEIGKGERVAVVGPNGAGKSTLLRLLAGLERPREGHVRLGEHGVVPSYYAQAQADAFEGNLTGEAVLRAAAPGVGEEDVRALLGRMGVGTAAAKPVSAMSGGERARLALARFMLGRGTFLVLDEPTNHLDIPSKEALEEALLAFDGSVLVASHDRYFLRRVATRVLSIRDGTLVDHAGGFAEYLRQDPAAAAAWAATEAARLETERAGIKSKSKTSRAERTLIDKGATRKLEVMGSKVLTRAPSKERRSGRRPGSGRR